MVSENLYYEALDVIKSIAELDKLEYSLDRIYHRRDLLKGILWKASIEGEARGKRLALKEIAENMCEVTNGHKWIRISTEEHARAGHKEFQCALCGKNKWEDTED